MKFYFLFQAASLEDAVYLARMVNHHQGFMLLRDAAKALFVQGEIDLAEVCRIWTNGCILRSQLLVHACQDSKKFDYFALPPQQRQTLKAALKYVATTALTRDVPVPCLTEALNFINGAGRAVLSSASLVQAQRDCFGAHRVDLVADTSGNCDQTAVHVDW